MQSKDSKRILPLYEVSFEYSEDFEAKNNGKNICHRCTDHDAIMFCPSERASFCKACDDEVHKDIFNKRHNRRYFSDLEHKVFICCDQHPVETIEYFCDRCIECLCKDCKITGSHSRGAFAEHELKPFVDACKTIKSELKIGEVCFEKHCNIIHGELNKIKEKVIMFRSNMTSVRKQIEVEIRNLILQLESIESENRQILNDKYLERVCMLRNYTQMISFPQRLDPAYLLYGYKCISDQRNGEQFVELENIDTERIEVTGKITLKFPTKQSSPHPTPRGGLSDNAVGWRIEAMHIDGKGKSNN